jgi:hypothetical protein
LRQAKRRLDEKRAAAAEPIPRSRPERLSQSKRRLEEELAVEGAANAAYEAYRARGVMKDGRRFGPQPKPYTPPDTPAGKVNVSYPDSRNVKTPRGYMQGYNAQAVATEQQIVIAAEANVDSSDFGHLAGMVNATEIELERAGVADTPEVVVADASYWHQKQMESVINKGIQILIPPDAGKRRGTRPGWDGGAYAHMRRVLETRPWRRALPKTQSDDRASVREHQVQPADRPIPPPRQIRCTLGMAADHRHPQPSEAPQAPSERCGSLTEAHSASRPRADHPSPTRSPARQQSRGSHHSALTQQPRRQAAVLTQSCVAQDRYGRGGGAGRDQHLQKSRVRSQSPSNPGRLIA